MTEECWTHAIDEDCSSSAPVWDPTNLPPFPIRRLHTPEREEACVVEGRFGIDDLAQARAWLDERYDRSGDGWVEVATRHGRAWLRAALWTADGRYPSLNIEAVSRECYARVHEEVSNALPGVRPRDERVVERIGFSASRMFGADGGLHSSKARRDRPAYGPREAVADLIEAEERRWLAAPNPLLDGRSPLEAVRDPEWIHGVYDLVEWVERVYYGGYPYNGNAISRATPTLACFNPHRLRTALGVGRSWADEPAGSRVFR